MILTEAPIEIACGPQGIISVLANGLSSYPSNFSASLQSAANWPTANKAFYVRIRILDPVLITKIWWMNGTAASGNVDTGIFHGITFVKLASTGSTARSGTSALQSVTLTNSVLLVPGTYLLGHASDTTTNSRTVYVDIANNNSCKLIGVTQETSAFPLPATATPATVASNFLWPLIGLYTAISGY